MSLQELQNTVKPLTLPDMVALRAKAEQDVVDKTKILYERTFQQRVLPRLTRSIELNGVMPTFGCNIDCIEAFGWTRVPNLSDIPKLTQELFQGFTEYVGGRLKTVFPDYNISSELKVEPSLFWRKNTLQIVLTRKDPALPTF